MHNRCSHKCLAPQTHRGPKSASLSVWDARPHGTQHITQQSQPSPLLTKHYRTPAGPTTTAFVMQRAGHDRCMEGAPHGMQRTWHVCGACCCGPRSHWGAGGAAAVISCGCIACHDPKQHAITKQSSHCRLRRRRRKSHCALIRRSAQVLEGHAPWSCTGTWARRTRSAPSGSTTRTSPSTSEVTCTQNNMVNSAKELVNRICSPPNVRKALGRG